MLLHGHPHAHLIHVRLHVLRRLRHQSVAKRLSIVRRCICETLAHHVVALNGSSACGLHHDLTLAPEVMAVRFVRARMHHVLDARAGETLEG